MLLLLGKQLVFHDRELDEEVRATPWFTRDTYISSHFFDDLFGDRKAESGSSDVSRERSLRLIEFLKNTQLIRFLYTDARIDDMDFKNISSDPCINMYFSLFRSELIRISEKIDHDLEESIPVSFYHESLEVDIDRAGLSFLLE